MEKLIIEKKPRSPISEASELVLEASAYARGGEIFVLDMGKPERIYDLARYLIWLSGLCPDEDIDIRVTDIRPGEKLYEETLLDDEGLSKTANDKIFVTKALHFDFDEMSEKVEGFIPLLESEHLSYVKIRSNNATLKARNHLYVKSKMYKYIKQSDKYYNGKKVPGMLKTIFAIADFNYKTIDLISRCIKKDSNLEFIVKFLCSTQYLAFKVYKFKN